MPEKPMLGSKPETQKLRLTLDAACKDVISNAMSNENGPSPFTTGS